MRKAPDRFDEELREWGSRPPQKSARQAATEVRRRIESPRPFFAFEPPRLQAAVALAALLLVALAAWLVLPPKETGSPAPPAPTVAELDPAPLSEGVVLMWLDSKTPLYMTFAAPRPHNGPAPRSPKGDAS